MYFFMRLGSWFGLGRDKVAERSQGRESLEQQEAYQRGLEKLEQGKKERLLVERKGLLKQRLEQAISQNLRADQGIRLSDHDSGSRAYGATVDIPTNQSLPKGAILDATINLDKLGEELEIFLGKHGEYGEYIPKTYPWDQFESFLRDAAEIVKNCDPK